MYCDPGSGEMGTTLQVTAAMGGLTCDTYMLRTNCKPDRFINGLPGQTVYIPQAG